MSDSLVATRARRLNAGSRLKKLIELEEQSVEERQKIIYTEDDENVNLLFQEDENDGEFEMSEQEEDEDQEEAEEDGEGESDGGEEVDSEAPRKRKHEEDAEVDADDVLSDSDLSETDSDQSEGEKELNKQEKLKKKKMRKKQSFIPAIKQPVAKQPAKKKAKSRPEFSAESLLSAQRSSSRSAVVENKYALAQKLKADEVRRAALKPVIRVKETEMTQKERLAEAIETEKANVIALNEFRELEIVKKETQRQLLLLKRKKLLNVVRFVTQEVYVTPGDEIAAAKREYEKGNSKPKRKVGRRKKNAEANSETIVEKRQPWEVDTELPLVKKEMEEKRKIEEEEAERRRKEEGEKMDVGGLDDSRNDDKDRDEQKENLEKHGEEEIVETDSESGKTNNSREASADLEKTSEENASEEKSAESSSLGETIEAKEEVEEEDKKEVKVEDEEEDKEELNEAVKEEVKEDEEMGEPEKDELEEGTNVKDEVVSEKKVKFADEVNEETESNESSKDTKEASPTPEYLESSPNPEEIEQDVYEGPPQRICRNTIYLIDFDDSKEHKLIEANIKTLLLGEQSLLPASHRFKDLKQIAKIGEIDNPYLTVVQRKDELFEAVTELTEEDSIFEELKRLPRFGEFEDIVEEEEADTEQVTSEIILKTEAPTSLYLANGNKKTCLITGTEVKYFDPANGIPYSSVETYRLLKQIEQGNIPWYSFGNDANDYGGAELYLGVREGARHAKGVPEGFDI